MRNRFSRASIVDPTSTFVVTMTTHGARLRDVHVALESIARGTVLPARVILWLDEERELTASLRRLQGRGLEIITVPKGLGVHTKYFPYVESLDAHTAALVTSDDDIIYPPDWLSGLVDASTRYPESIVCYRAHRITFDGDVMAPYAQWVPAEGRQPTPLHFGTSVSGQVFPAHLLQILQGYGKEFLEKTPKNDDIWVHRVAVAHGIGVALVREQPQHFPFVPGTQASGLYMENAWGGLNDSQNAATYTADDIAALLAAR